MIFVTVGSQLPFDRLIRAVDDWCAQHSTQEVFAQIADPGSRGYYPKNVEWKRYLDPEQFERRLCSATLIIAHAGMGSIISALMAAKPIVIMPRRAPLHEHRNDHQYATANKFQSRENVHVALNASDLGATIDLAFAQQLTKSKAVDRYASPSLVSSLRRCILFGQDDDGRLLT